MRKGHGVHPKEEHHEEKQESHEGRKISPGIAIFVVALIIIIVFLILSGKLKF